MSVVASGSNVEFAAALEKVLCSKAFSRADSIRQVLKFIVEEAIDGNCDNIKEYSIATEGLGRPPDFDPKADSIVRVQVQRLRKRLDEYYCDEGAGDPVRIEIPAGGYVPTFHALPIASLPGRSQEPIQEPQPSRRSAENPRKLRLVTTIALGLALALALVLVTLRVHYGKEQESPLDKFWSPVFSTAQPVLICLPKPVVYLPSFDVYQRFSKGHPEAFRTWLERFNNELPLDRNDVLRWGDMVPTPGLGLATGDVYVAIRLTALFTRINKPCQVRFGSNYSFEDLRNSPAVLVGSLDNRWTGPMTSDLRFVFAEGNNGRIWIEERGPSRRIWSWHLGPHNAIAEDFGVVTRLLNAKSGQVLVVAAGLSIEGTQAAGEFISTENALTEALRTAPPDWDKKNLQVVVETTVTDSVPGPPRVVATYSW